MQLFTEEEADALPVRHPRRDQADPRGAGAAAGDRAHGARPLARQLLRRDRAGGVTARPTSCPGIDFSNDPLLQGRLFSYLDTQLSRLGAANFHQIPINAPKCPFANQQRDGHMQMQVPKGRVNYEPTASLEPASSAAARDAGGGFRSFAALAESSERKGRIRAETFADHYSQARLFFRSQTAIEQAHMASRWCSSCRRSRLAHVREAHGRPPAQRRRGPRPARRRRPGHGALPPAPPAAGAPSSTWRLRRRCSIIGKMKDTLEGRAVGILVADGSDGAAGRGAAQGAPRPPARRVKIVAPKVGGVKLEGRQALPADGQLAGTPSVLFDAVALVLSDDGARQLLAKEARRSTSCATPSATSRRSPSTPAASRCWTRPAWQPDGGVVERPRQPRLHRGRQDAAVEPGAGRAHARLKRASRLRQSFDGATSAPKGAMLAGEDAGAQRGALGAHFRSRIPALLDAWRLAIAADPDLTTGDSLPRGQLVDHLPPWLEGWPRRWPRRPVRPRRAAADPTRRGMPRRTACSAGSRATTCTRSRASGGRCICAWWPSSTATSPTTRRRRRCRRTLG